MDDYPSPEEQKEIEIAEYDAILEKEKRIDAHRFIVTRPINEVEKIIRGNIYTPYDELLDKGYLLLVQVSQHTILNFQLGTLDDYLMDPVLCRINPHKLLSELNVLGILKSYSKSKKCGPTDKTKDRASCFKKLKDQNKTWSQEKVGFEASQILGIECSGETVDNAYKAMGWKWERADRIR